MRASRHGYDDEAELPARCQQQAGAQAVCPTDAEPPGERDDRQQLQQHHAGESAHDQQRVRDQRADVQAHADGDQEHPEEQAFERLDRDLDLAAVFGASEQQAADQST